MVTKRLHKAAAIQCRADAGRDPGHPAEPSAIDALDRVTKAHVDAWRVANNMQEDSDFAFAFSTFEGAQTAGGHHLAAAWIAARTAQTSELMHAAASVIEASPPRRRRDHVAAVRAPVRSWAISKRRGLRLQPNNQESPEALVRKARGAGRNTPTLWCTTSTWLSFEGVGGRNGGSHASVWDSDL